MRLNDVLRRVPSRVLIGTSGLFFVILTLVAKAAVGAAGGL